MEWYFWSFYKTHSNWIDRKSKALAPLFLALNFLLLISSDIHFLILKDNILSLSSTLPYNFIAHYYISSTNAFHQLFYEKHFHLQFQWNEVLAEAYFLYLFHSNQHFYLWKCQLSLNLWFTWRVFCLSFSNFIGVCKYWLDLIFYWFFLRC